MIAIPDICVRNEGAMLLWFEYGENIVFSSKEY